MIISFTDIRPHPSPSNVQKSSVARQPAADGSLPARYQDKIAALMGRLDDYQKQAETTPMTHTVTTPHYTPPLHHQSTPQTRSLYAPSHTYTPLHIDAHSGMKPTTSPQMRNLTSDITSEFVQKLDKYLKDDEPTRANSGRNLSNAGRDPADITMEDLTSPRRDLNITLTNEEKRLNSSFHGPVSQSRRTRAERLQALREQVDSLQDKLASKSCALLDPNFTALVPSQQKVEEIIAKHKNRFVAEYYYLY